MICSHAQQHHMRKLRLCSASTNDSPNSYLIISFPYKLLFVIDCQTSFAMAVSVFLGAELSSSWTNMDSFSCERSSLLNPDGFTVWCQSRSASSLEYGITIDKCFVSNMCILGKIEIGKLSQISI